MPHNGTPRLHGLKNYLVEKAVKVLRFIHDHLGNVGLIFLLVIAAMFAWDCFREAKASRMEVVENKMLERLKAYHQANGRYPDSLRVLVIANSPQEIQTLADIQLIDYQRTNGGFVLSYKSADGYQSFRHETW
jgi:hypothetical protein